MDSLRIAVCLFAIFSMVLSAQAEDFILDSNEHLDIVTEYINGVLYDSSTANVLEGGNISDAYVNDIATLKVFGGSVNYLNAYNRSIVDISSSGQVYYLAACDDSIVSISGGSTDSININNHSTINISGGSINGTLSANDSSIVNLFEGEVRYLSASGGSIVNISGGSIDRLQPYDYSIVNISGGAIYGELHANSINTVNISGGSINEGLYAEMGTVIFNGYDFRLTGNLSWDIAREKILGTGVLTGKWFDDTIFVIKIRENRDTATIKVISEPVEPKCGDMNHPYPPMDFNYDCIVNFSDFALFMSHWLDCTAPE